MRLFTPTGTLCLAYRCGSCQEHASDFLAAVWVHGSAGRSDGVGFGRGGDSEPLAEGCPLSSKSSDDLQHTIVVHTHLGRYRLTLNICLIRVVRRLSTPQSCFFNPARLLDSGTGQHCTCRSIACHHVSRAKLVWDWPLEASPRRSPSVSMQGMPSQVSLLPLCPGAGRCFMDYHDALQLVYPAAY